MDKDIAQHVSRSTFVQVVLGLIVNFSSLAPSMTLGFPAIVLPVLTSEDNPNRFTEDEGSWIASVASIAAPIGCLLSGPVADKYGRKVSLLCNNIICFLGWVIIWCAYYTTQYQYAVLIVGRLFTGLSTGFASMPAAVYMAEVSSPSLRGMFTTWNSVAFSLGVFIVYVLGWILRENWGLVAAISAGFSFVGTIMTLIYVSESPSWLISKNRLKEAKASVIKIFGAKSDNLTVQEEIENLMQNRSSQSEEEVSFLNNLKCFLKRSGYVPFALMVTFFFFQQFTGIVVMVVYAVDIIEKVRITIDSYFVICLMAVVRVVASFSVGYLSKFYGRRPLSLISGSGMTICMTFICIFLKLTDSIPTVDRSSLDWLPILVLMVFFFISTIGFITMPFAMTAEVFPGEIRGVGSGLVTCCSYAFSFSIVKIYPTMMSSMGNYYVFLFYGVVSLIGTIFIFILLPETKDKTLQEIEDYFSGKSKNIEIKYDLESLKVQIPLVSR